MIADSIWDGVRSALEDGVREAAFPGASLLVGRGDVIVTELQVGRLCESGQPVAFDTIYDLSSLTKPLATQAALLVLIGRGRVALDEPFVRIFPEFEQAGPSDETEARCSVTVADLLSHQAGLKAVCEMWRDLEAAQPDIVGRSAAAAAVAESAARVALEYAPRSKAVYSDLGYIMLGAAIERLSGVALDSFVTDEVLAPLAAVAGYRRIGTGKSADDVAAVAPSGNCDWRGGAIRGEVQDENAWAMGGVAGHAGLFGTARGVHSLVAEYVNAFEGAGKVLDSELVRRCWSPVEPTAADSTWVLGWDTPTRGNSSAGRLISPGSVGHLGFTGTSVWVDRARGVHVILLTNRLHPDRDNIAIRRLRPLIHDAVFAAIDGKPASATTNT